MNFWNFEYTIDVDLKHQIMFGKIYGIWKKDTAESYAEELKEAANPLIKKPWVKLMDLTNWKIAHQEVIQIVGDLNRWCRKNNMAWAVYIINERASYNQLMKMLTKGDYHDIGKTFRSRNEAEKFLKEHGFSVPKLDDSGLFK
jgi:hypothetical protein